MFRLFIPLIAMIMLTSCGQKAPVRNFETGQIMKVKMGTVKKVNKFLVTRDAAGEGTFAGMASNAVTAITPGLLAEGTSRIASATGAMMDSKLETVARVRIRIEMDREETQKVAAAAPAPAAEGDKAAAAAAPKPLPPPELVEIIQNDIPGMEFYEGQKVVISTTSVPGNAWPE